MSKFAAMLGIEIEPASSSNLTLGSFAELCHMHKIRGTIPIRVFMLGENICYWANQIDIDDNRSQVIMSRTLNDVSSTWAHSSSTWTPDRLADINAASSFKLVDAERRHLRILGWGADNIVLESQIESVP